MNSRFSRSFRHIMLSSMDFDPQGTHISVFYSLVQFQFSLQTLRRTSFEQCFFLTLAPLILKTFAGLHKFFSTFHHIEPTLFLNPLNKNFLRRVAKDLQFPLAFSVALQSIQLCFLQMLSLVSSILSFNSSYSSN